MSLLDAIPVFARLNKFVRDDILTSSNVPPGVKSEESVEVTNIKDANLITSEISPGFHRPVLDIDFNAELIPSSTPGHFHLFLDRNISWESYLEFMQACEKVGILQSGFVEGAKKRGWSSVRMPHIKKDKIEDNVIDYEAYKKKLKDKEELDKFYYFQNTVNQMSKGPAATDKLISIDLFKKLVNNMKDYKPVKTNSDHISWVPIGHTNKWQVVD